MILMCMMIIVYIYPEYLKVAILFLGLIVMFDFSADWPKIAFIH